MMDNIENLGDLIDVTKSGSDIAIIDCSKPFERRSYTYSQLQTDVQACARGLLKSGLKKGDAVAILSVNRVEFLVTYLAIMQVGMIAVPVNHKLAKDTIQLILHDCNAKLIFVDQARKYLAPNHIPSISFDEGGWKDFQEPGFFKPVSVLPSECAMILYTSGSTGRPKGVLLSHAGQIWTIKSRFRVRSSYEDECFIVAAPLFHMNALTNVKFAIAAHATLVLMPQFDTHSFIDALEKYEVTWITSVPTMMAMVVREGDLSKVNTHRVNFIRLGSAPATEQLYDAIAKYFPNATIAGGYGTTEAGPIVFGPVAGNFPSQKGGLGWPLPDVEVRLVDAHGKDADEGVLWMRTPANLIGYLNLPEQTNKVLTSDGWYISGDTFRKDYEGCYYFIGRTDDMFNCGGENIYPGEVEQVIERMPGVMQACVVPIEDELKGKKPIAFVVLQAGISLSESQIKEFVLANAPAYQHPRHVVFVSELPLAATNKIDRQLLTHRAAQLFSTSYTN